MKYAWFFILLLSFPIVLYAQDKGEKVYTLQDCINIAIEQNPEILKSGARLKSSGADITSAFGNFLPSADFSMGYSRQLNSDGGRTVNVGGQIIPVPSPNPNSYNMSAGASYLIFDGFSRGANYNRAQSNFDAFYANDLFTKSSVLNDIYQKYIQVIQSKQIVKIRKENLELGKKQLEQIQAQFDAGTTHIGAVYSQEADLGQREFDLITAENNLDIAKANLMTTMGLDPDVTVDFDEYSLPQEINDLEIDNFRKNIGSYESAAQATLKNRQDLQALGKSIEASKSSLTIAESGYYPSVSAFGGWSWANSELNQFDELGRSYIGLSFRVPIFDQFNTNYQIQNAKAQLYQAEVDKSYQEKQALSSLKIAYLNLEAAEKKLDITERAYKAADVNYQSYKERFSVGKSNVTDLLNANKLLVEAQINRTTAVYDYFGAQKSIEFNLGQLEK
jgi:outer membrane protein